MWDCISARPVPVHLHLRAHENCCTSSLCLRTYGSLTESTTSKQHHQKHPVIIRDQKLPRCQKAMRESCIDQFDSMNCRAAVNFCDSELSTEMWATGKHGLHGLFWVMLI